MRPAPSPATVTSRAMCTSQCVGETDSRTPLLVEQDALSYMTKTMYVVLNNKLLHVALFSVKSY